MLNININHTIKVLGDNLENRILAEVKEITEIKVEKISRTIENVEDETLKLNDEIKRQLVELNEKKEKFFKMDSLKTKIFWSGYIANIATFLAIIYMLMK